jgi:hypothetical protein
MDMEEEKKSDRHDWLAEQIIAVFEKNHSDSPSYVDKIKSRLKGADRLECMIYINNMDNQNQRALCEKLEINHAHLKIFLEVLSHL